MERGKAAGNDGVSEMLKAYETWTTWVDVIAD